MLAIIAQRKSDNIPFRIPKIYYYSEKDANGLDILTRNDEYVDFDALNEYAIEGDIYVLNAIKGTADQRERVLTQILSILNVRPESLNSSLQDPYFTIALKEIKYIGNDLLYIFQFSAQHRIYNEPLDPKVIWNHICQIKHIWQCHIEGK